MTAAYFLFEKEKVMNNGKLDVIVPVAMDLDWPDRERVIASIREQKKNYGIDRFVLAGPGGGWRSVGFPPLSFYQEQAAFFKSIRDELKGEGISCGWWVTITIKSGASSEWGRIVKMDGSEAPFSSCPADPVFRKRFAESIAVFCKTAQPDFVFFEDDFSICASSQSDGCFCKHHLDLFSEREGKVYTREMLKTAIENKEIDILHRWRELMRDTLADFCKVIRSEVDKCSPQIPFGSMQPGVADKDGDTTEAVARALAGSRHKPFSRISGTFYGGENIERIPEELYHALYTRQHVGKDFLCYHESDTFPHTRFFTSAACMQVLMGSAYAMGFAGSTFQTQQLLDDPNEEDGYGLMFSREKPRFEAIMQAAKHCTLQGAGILYDPFWASVEPAARPGWVRCVSHFGIPCVSTPSDVTFLSGKQPVFLSDDDLCGLLKKGVILDAEAAAMLCDRGFSSLTGVAVSGEAAVSGKNLYDLAGREVISDTFAADSCGRHMHRADFFSPGGNGRGFLLEPLPGCEVITDLLSYQKKHLSPGMTRFVNRLGGRVVVLGQTVANNRSSSLFNYRRQKLMQELINWCGGNVVMVKNAARVFVIQNEADDPEKAGFAGMLMLSNLNPDPAEEIELYLPGSWRQFKHFEMLDRNARIVPLDCTPTADGIRLNTPLEYAHSMVIFGR